MSNFVKIRALGAELFRADKQKNGKTGGGTDRRTDVREAKGSLSHFANTTKLCTVTTQWMFVFCMNVGANNFYTAFAD